MRFERRHPVRATAPQSDRRFSVSNPVLCVLAALVIAYPSLAAAPPTKVGGRPQSIASLISNAVDCTHKGDRLVPAGATFAARWNIQDASGGNDLRPARSQRPMERQMKAKIPFGCDPAFGPLVHANFSARCLASVRGRTKLAAFV
jgi:hypothetical protein